jgi:hypothetical protein
LMPKKEMIGYCGYNCNLCAARSDDPAVRQKLVDGWRKLLGHEMYTAENVKCAGCPSDGEVADKQCTARPCAKKKGIDSCARCDKFMCGKMSHLVGWSVPPSDKFTQEEYDLCLRQFVSMPNLLKVLAEEGKLPDWMAKHLKHYKY